MVMESVTLTSPQRKYNVIPVQKSLSLPSYARAGGEGIDHKLIFAALEQREKVRRKSRIFTREKSARPNIFCLPIPTSAKCKETSLSSDTSCSSLEYQKPKPVAKAKKEDTAAEKATSINDKPLNETEISKTNHSEPKSNIDPIRRDDLAQNVTPRHLTVSSSLRVSEHRKGHRSPVDTLKANVGSSDSMDRSSRSSNDSSSISRKERLVAIKARVEAAREKYGESSSEEEARTAMTRYSSDGVIHRTATKSRTSRYEKQRRRQSQDEWAVKKAKRQSILSLSLHPENNDIKLESKQCSRTEMDIHNLEIKTDFCPSPNFPDTTKKSYFSDFPNKENSERFVKARIRHIEDEERKRRSGSDFREKIVIPSRQSPQHLESPNSTAKENWRQMDIQNGLHDINTSEKLALSDLAARASPIPKSSQAPTPPPRSPKSITLVNKAFIQHQNASLMHHENSLERQKYFQSNIQITPYANLFDRFNSKSEATINDSKYTNGAFNTSSEKQKIRELINSRRKTCGNFDFIEKSIFSDTNTGSLCTNSFSTTNNNVPSATQMKKIDNKGYLSSTESPFASTEGDSTNKMWKTKWHENEQRREFMFNSLESKRKNNVPSWMRWKNPPLKTETCLCSLFPNNNLSCICKTETNLKGKHTNPHIFSSSLESDNLLNSKDISSLAVQYPSERLSKSEVNIAFTNSLKTLATDVKENRISDSLSQDSSDERAFKNKSDDKKSATANLDSAMEELESVYRSLKISSDNLSDKNSISNSLSGDEMPKPRSNYDSMNGFQRRSSVCNSTLNSTITKSNLHDISLMNDIKRHQHLNPKLNTTLSNSVSASDEKPSDVNQFSIDELFNDLTQQLDFEQKLLKEPRDNRPHQPKICCQANSFNGPKRSNNPSSQISIRKEFYDNLCKNKNNLAQNKISNPIDDGNNNEKVQLDFIKKKYKAVRSLSENISLLMATANSGPAVSRNAVLRTNEPLDKISKPITTENSSPNFNGNARNPMKLEATDARFKISNFLNKTEEGSKNLRQEEIRHIRVSMDTSDFQTGPSVKDSFSTNKQYPSLSSAVSSSQKIDVPKYCLKEMAPACNNSKDSNILDEAGVEKLLSSLLGEAPEHQHPDALLSKSPKPSNHCHQGVSPTSCNSKENDDVLEETGLEKILNRLLNETPDRQQSSLLLSKDLSPSTPPPSGKLENVKANRNILPSKMDIYVASNTKNTISNVECRLKNDKSDENAQKLNEFRQNNNAVVNQMSFIPVYTRKTNMCHNFPKNNTEDEKNKHEPIDLQESSTPVNNIHSPPVQQKCLNDQKEKLAGRTLNMFVRRRSVGFEDITSTCYEYNMSNENRLKPEQLNSNIATGQVLLPKNVLNPEKGNIFYGKGRETERGTSSQNQNAKITDNENTHIQRTGRPSIQQLKDKSSKRKSSLNRIDFVDFPSTRSGNNSLQKATCYQRNSSSDEDHDDKPLQTKSEFLSSSIKRKHKAGSNQAVSKLSDRELTEVPIKNNPSGNRFRANMLPRTIQNSHSKLRLNKRIQAAAAHLQKFSHSAGELESLTDLSEAASVPNKICLSAQEFDAHETLTKSKYIAKPPSKNSAPLLLPAKASDHTASAKNCIENTSHDAASKPIIKELCSNLSTQNETVCSSSIVTNSEGAKTDENVQEDANLGGGDSILKDLNLNGALDLKHIDSRSEDDSELLHSTAKMKHLDISSDKDIENETYISAEENCDALGSDSERRPSSILRKKYFEEKKELHGILKPPPNEKQSKTPPSILKHRESSEEKDVWQQSDLHSILKKSTSEDESCNSGPDIRPILKVSTDEDSPGGSVRPRPILKKRTSFSEECSYASFPNGELKPILKKTAPVPLEEQPKPILKSRRKSEDARSSMSEFITSRPRAYSADMGVKNYENRLDGLDINKEGLNKQEYHNS